MNPSHILIARNSRAHGQSHTPSASLSSPTETHAAASGIFRSSAGPGSPPWYLEEEAGAREEEGDEEDDVEVDETFTLGCKFPGSVKIVVESTTFWAHKELLVFASPFFEAALSGNWAETSGGGGSSSGRPASISSVITISQPPSIPGNEPNANSKVPPEMTFAPVDSDASPTLDEGGLGLDLAEVDSDSNSGDDKDNKVESEPEPEPEPEPKDDASAGKPTQKAKQRESALNKLVQGPKEQSKDKDKDKDRDFKDRDFKDEAQQTVSDLNSSRFGLRGRSRQHHKSLGPDAVVVLREEKASTFHDFLKYVYPHLQCTITWNNVEGLMNISHKLCVPSLQTDCRSFLLSHAAGKPIKAMRIAELFDEDELYREASRFVLDNPGGWSEEELSTLGRETLLKLEKRRTWFLERVLKLGLVQIAKEYECCPTCPDSSICAKLLEEKWRQAYQSVFRFGPCQPSMVYRYLRTFEGVSPPLALTHLSCQNHAKAFVATLFDRMFSLGLRGSGTETAPLAARMGVPAASTPGPRRHFLYCTLKTEAPSRKK